MEKFLTRSDLLSVEKPARYVGGEYNQIIKDKNRINCRFALCYADVYEVGMSNINTRIIYSLLNKKNDVWCERVFSPCVDFEGVLRKNGIKLYSLESKDSLDEFDIIYFDAKSEINYINILNMLELGGVEILSSNRENMSTIVIVGGICSKNPYPLSNFVDIFLIGKKEELIGNIVQKYIDFKESGKKKWEFLDSIKDIDGIFMPSIHNQNSVINKVEVEDLDLLDYPSSYVIPNMDIEKNRIIIEISRGGERVEVGRNYFRFCQSSYTSGETRLQSLDKIIKLVDDSLKNTGQNEIEFLFQDATCYNYLEKLLEKMDEIYKEKNLKIFIPFIGMNYKNLYLLSMFQNVYNKEVTFDIGAGNNRLREMINSNFTEWQIFDCCRTAYEIGITNITLKFTIGLPTENYEDIGAISTLVNKIVEIFEDEVEDENEITENKFCITLKISNFIPRSHTPFEFCGQNSQDKLELKQRYLKDKIESKNVKYIFDNPQVSIIEGVIARGDKSISDVIFDAFKNGARYDSTEKSVDIHPWNKALSKINFDVKGYAGMEYDVLHNFPWDNINYGVEKDFLVMEYKRALNIK